MSDEQYPVKEDSPVEETTQDTFRAPNQTVDEPVETVSYFEEKEEPDSSIEFDLGGVEEPTAVAAEESEEEEAYIESSTGTPKVTITDDHEGPDVVAAKGKSASEGSLAIPSLPLDEFNAYIKSVKSIAEAIPEMLKEWREVVAESIGHYSPAGLYQSRFTDEDSDWRQGVMNGGNLTQSGPLKFKNSSGELKGELALLKITKFLGMGEVYNVMLPHSGIWVTIKPPSERDFIDFYNLIFRDKVRMGRATSGFTLTNMSVQVNNRLFDFILQHIHSVNYSDIGKEELDSKILIHDFPILAWGMACAIYPNGFNHSRACTANIEECARVATTKLNLDKLAYVDNGTLTMAQRNILSENRPNKLTIDSYKKYQAEHDRVTGTVFVSKQGVKFKFMVPTFKDYTTNGLKWVNQITNTVEQVLLGKDASEDDKLNTLNQYVNASSLRQYNHFIEYIEADGSVITDRDTIDSLLDLLSGDDDIRKELTTAILKYKSKTSIALIGIPEYKCKSCGGLNKLEGVQSSVTNVIPLDTLGLFFLMLTSKISKIIERGASVE